MPLVNIRLARRDVPTTAAQKAALIAGVTQLMQQVLDKRPESVTVIIDEVDLQNLFEAFSGIALECNREEWMLRMRRMGSCPCKQPGRPIARFHSNPSGKCLAGRSAALHRLPIARAIGRALRLASHPGKVLVRLQKDLEQALSPPVFRRVRARAEEGAAPAVKLGRLWPKSPFLPLSPNRLMLPASCATAVLRCSAPPQWPSGSAVICRRSWRSIPIGQIFPPMNF